MTRPITRRDLGIGTILAGVYLAMLCSTLDIGFPRDESFYFSAGEQYSYWFDDLVKDPKKAFTQAVVDKHFAYNPEHPALPKMLFGLSWRIFGDMRDAQAEPFVRPWYDRGGPPKPILGWFSESTAMRLPALVLNSLLVLLIYLFGAEFFSRRVGFVAALAWMFQPHAFWHGHLAVFDIPVTVLWFATAWAFLKSVTRGTDGRGAWKWALWTAVLWGVALNMKHNAFFLPPVLVLWWLLARRREFGADRGPGGIKLRFPGIPAAFVAMLLVSPVVYYVLWPKLWHHPITHWVWYFKRHAFHEYYWAYYWGTLYTKPPFPLGFSFLMSAITIPGTTLILFAVGSARMTWEWGVRAARGVGGAARRAAAALPVRSPGLVLFVFLNFFIPFLVIGNGRTPIFGGTKHWIHGVPYLCLLAGLGFEWIWDGLRDASEWIRPLRTRLARGALVALALAAFLAAPVVDTLHGHTNGSTYYNAFVGGYAAMGEHGLQREFWGNSAFSALEFINENAAPNAKVDFHDTTWDAVRMYLREGKLRRDVQAIWDFKSADWFLFHWHKEFLDIEADARDFYGVEVPSFVAAQDGVPVLNAWERPGRRGGKP